MVPPQVVGPLTANEVVPIDIGAAEPTSSVPDTVIFELKVFVPVPLVVRLLNVVTVLSVCAAPPKFTVPVPGVKFVPVPAH
ncbi:MAG: hypothetical protein ACKVRN_12090, partial [Pyrinomonadaceae bacterium]